jgi:hypothetical protein
LPNPFNYTKATIGVQIMGAAFSKRDAAAHSVTKVGGKLAQTKTNGQVAQS